jgi:DNA-binding HxlR family transcriptional regulator
MSSKENVAVNQLLSLLESRYAIRVLWALRDNRPQTFRLLQDSVGGITPNTLNTRIKELREAGFLTHGSDGYLVTSSGADLLKRLSDLQAFSSKWVNAKNKPALEGAEEAVAPAAPAAKKMKATKAVKAPAKPAAKTAKAAKPAKPAKAPKAAKTTKVAA